jgi:hypothetical protein
MKITSFNNFTEIYEMVLNENINLEKVKNVNDFIKELEKTKENPYLSTLLKEEYFEIKDNKVIDTQGWWNIQSRAVIEFDDNSKAKIFGNGSYWWINAIIPKGKKVKQYFYYTD